MLEAEKMLHLRRYFSTALRIDARSRVVRSLHSASQPSQPSPLRDRGYVSRYVAPSSSRPRSNYSSAVARLRTYGTTTAAHSSADEVDQKLTSLCDDARRGQVSAARLREVIELYDDESRRLQPDAGVLLLGCCGNLPSALAPAERRALTDQVWRIASRDTQALTSEHYDALLDAHVRNGRSVKPGEFLAGMSVEPNERTWRLLLNAVAEAGSIEHLRDVVAAIKERNVSLEEDALDELARAYVASGNPAEVERAIKVVRDAKLPTGRFYTELACRYAALGDIPNLAKIMNDEPQSDASLLRILKTLSASNNGRYIPVVMNSLMKSVPRFNTEILRTIAELVREDRAADAHTIVNCLAMNEATANHAKDFANGFLNELIMTNTSVEDVVRYANDFVDSGCDPLALTNTASAGLKLGRESLCHELFDAMRKRDMDIRPHFYWPLLLSAYRRKGESKVFSLVESMMENNVEIEFDTLVSYVFPYVNTVNPNITLQRLQALKLPGNVLLTPMVAYLLSRNRLEEAITVCKSMKTKPRYKDLLKPLTRYYLATKDAANCATLLTLHPIGNEFVGWFLYMLLNGRHSSFFVEDLQLLLQACNSRGAKITQRDATILKEKVASFVVDRTSSLARMIDSLVDDGMRQSALAPLLHARYMNTKDMACYLVELKHKGFPVKGTLRKLLEAYYSENNLKGAMEVKREIDADEGSQWTPGMKVYLFELYLRHNKLKEAETVLAELKNISNEFKIDNSKILLFAIALVRGNRPKSAFDVVEEHGNFQTRRDVQRICYNLLDALADSEYHGYTHDMLQLLVERNYCEVTTELLRPLVAIPLQRNDVLSAVGEFMKCVEKYNRMPLAQEVLTALLGERDKSKLYDKYIEQIFNMISKLKGSEVATTSLAIGLATLNKTQELQAVLKVQPDDRLPSRVYRFPSLITVSSHRSFLPQEQRVSMTALMHFSNYAQRTNKAEILYKIFEATPSTSNMDQVVLCNFLLSAYSKENFSLRFHISIFSKRKSRYSNKLYTNRSAVNVDNVSVRR